MFSAARWRLALWFAGAFAVILVLIGGAVYGVTRASLYDQVDDDLRTRNAVLLSTLIRDVSRPPGPRIQRDQFRLAASLLSAGGYSAAIVVEGEDEPVGTANIEEIAIPSFEELEADVGEGSATIDTSTSDGEDIRLRVERLGPTSFITVGRSIEPEQQALNRLIIVLVGGGVFGLVLASGSGFILSGRALRPIRQAMDAQRTFVADASHELRTPLALIRANAEIMKREGAGESAESVDDIIKEADHLNYLIGQMLTLARADVSEAPFASEDVDLSHLAGDVVREAQVLAREKAITLVYEGESGLHVLGDGQRLREVLLILLDNAFKYSAEGGSVKVRLTADGAAARLAVADNGHGIPAADLPHVFDRFYRVDKARSREMGGTGLGLAIARWIAEEHGGSIRLESTAGEGTTVTVELPAAKA
ncbi:MAG: ATP-binding protein [Chloroflexi bacterium]|nr:ATP-binding protein [Chloroflexota bacterium]MCI0782964.1 ATP-binding protein [Chloroflexota bacterium]MCI0817339.1 ATP-binding protein [Chloroflexota bacterium]MCI0832083.1 ATP-binding protein [Chloroflexota bacterium]MCI0839130.1 ATP-binding protein [Chloroflexota bacterium]